MNLDELRKRIDEIDSELHHLLRERMQVSQAIGRYKFKNKIEIENKEREKDILKIEGSFSKEIKAVYQTILQESRNIQKHDFLLIGKKLNYSLSPLIYKLFGLDNYQLWETNFFSEVVPLNYKGINITNPFKHDAFKYCTEVSDIARKLASVNLIIKDGNNLYGDNTDYYGFIKTLEYFQIDVKGKRALIIGNGAT